MKVLVASTVFSPRIGGMETVAALLVQGLVAENHSVTVITCVKSNVPDTDGVRIIRQPSWLRTLQCFLESDAVICLGPTIRLGWPLLLFHRKALISHHVYPHSTSRLARWLRNRLAKRSKHVACSKAVADSIGPQCAVVGSPYEDGLFTICTDVSRSAELVFLGRLVPEKGVDILLEALALLSRKRLQPQLHVAGSGPLRSQLEETAERLGIGQQVQFLGPVVGEPLVTLLNRHRILVVPSSWNEPFGIVALEGIACGCAVIGSSGGGLPDAIGPCGLTFPNRDPEKLADAIESLLKNPELLERYRSQAPEHLRRYSPKSVVCAYLNCLHAN